MPPRAIPSDTLRRTRNEPHRPEYEAHFQDRTVLHIVRESRRAFSTTASHPGPTLLHQGSFYTTCSVNLALEFSRADARRARRSRAPGDARVHALTLACWTAATWARGRARARAVVGWWDVVGAVPRPGARGGVAEGAHRRDGVLHFWVQERGEPGRGVRGRWRLWRPRAAPQGR